MTVYVQPLEEPQSFSASPPIAETYTPYMVLLATSETPLAAQAFPRAAYTLEPTLRLTLFEENIYPDAGIFCTLSRFESTEVHCTVTLTSTVVFLVVVTVFFLPEEEALAVVSDFEAVFFFVVALAVDFEEVLFFAAAVVEDFEEVFFFAAAALFESFTVSSDTPVASVDEVEELPL